MRHPSIRAAAGLALAACALLATAAAAEPYAPRPVQIILQDYQQADCDACKPLDFLIVAPLLALEDRARMRSLAAQYAVLAAKLPGLDIPSAVRSAFCRALSPAKQPDCAEVSIAGHGDPSRRTTGTQNASTVLLVRLSIEYTRMMRFNELRLIGTFTDVQGPDSKARPFLYMWYTTPGTDATPTSPLEKSSSPETAKQRAAREHWFTGTPTLMEREIVAGIEDIAKVAGEVVPKLLATDPAVGADWWQNLKTLEDYQAEGNFKCRGAACGMRAMGITGDRLRHVQQSNGVIVMSAPLEVWR